MEEKEKRKGKSPLLYIHQPDFVRPEFSMQYSFSSSPNTTTSPENKINTNTKEAKE